MLGGLVAGLLVMAMAPRNERAMFFVGSPPSAQAFAAIVPPVGYLPIVAINDGRPGRRLARNPFVRRSNVAEPPSPAELGPAGAGGPIGENAAPAGTGGPIPAGFDSAPGGVGGPQGPLLGGSSPAAPVGGGGGSTGGVDGGTGPVAPVAPVPEPATWAMLVFGFLAVGMTLRRARGRQKADPGAMTRY